MLQGSSGWAPWDRQAGGGKGRQPRDAEMEHWGHCSDTGCAPWAPPLCGTALPKSYSTINAQHHKRSEPHICHHNNAVTLLFRYAVSLSAG